MGLTGWMAFHTMQGMMMARRTRCMVAFSMASFLVVASLAKSSVLCLGADGHASIEAVGALCCSTERASANGDEAALRFASSPVALSFGTSCGSCVDIPLSTISIVAACSRVAPPELSFLASPCLLAWCFYSLPLPLSSAHLPSRSLAGLGAGLSRLRTVVLRR